MAQNYTFETKESGESEITITGEITTEAFESERSEAIKELGATVKIKGFRQGKIPDEVLVKHVGDGRILDEMAQRALSRVYPEILREAKISAIGRPQITLTKVAAGNPLGFMITTAVMPTIEIADYAKIAKKENANDADVRVEDKEIDDAINELRRMNAHYEAMQNRKEGEDAPKMADIKDEDLPELNDAFAQKLGSFKTVDELKTQLTNNLTEEKKHKAIDKKRMAIVEAIIDKSKITLPQILVDHELDKMMAQLEGDITSSGMKVEDYLEKVKKTREDLKKEWHETAVKRAKMQLILNTIAEKEAIKADEKKVEEEFKTLIERYGEDPHFDEYRARSYVEMVLTNQAVFDYLENLK